MQVKLPPSLRRLIRRARRRLQVELTAAELEVLAVLDESDGPKPSHADATASVHSV